jgi:hypothetical protein
MQNARIYVALVDEGVPAWRPVPVRSLGDDIYEVLGIIPPGEKWEFLPGSQVRCRQHKFEDGSVGLRAYERVPI